MKAALSMFKVIKVCRSYDKQYVCVGYLLLCEKTYVGRQVCWATPYLVSSTLPQGKQIIIFLLSSCEVVAKCLFPYHDIYWSPLLNVESRMRYYVSGSECMGPEFCGHVFGGS